MRAIASLHGNGNVLAARYRHPATRLKVTAMHQTRNDLSPDVRARVGQLLNNRLASAIDLYLRGVGDNITPLKARA
jgi:hypothetical protein